MHAAAFPLLCLQCRRGCSSQTQGRSRCLAHGHVVTGVAIQSAASLDVGAQQAALDEEAVESVPAVPLPQTSPPLALTTTSSGVPVNLVPFSAAPGAGWPFCTPSCTAIVLLAILAARESRPKRGLAVEALSMFNTARPSTTPAVAPPVLDAEAFEALQKADAERRAREAAAEAAREVERRRVVEAERARIEASACASH